VDNREARDEGIEAYDCEYQEMVMLIPWLLAMNGDNPMQSEFSSHIGTTGKCFCRVCFAKGADTINRPDGDEGAKERVREFIRVTFTFSKPLQKKLNAKMI
jgi:hypothetical protein